MSVVNNLDQFRAAGLDLDGDMAGTGINGILDQLFNDTEFALSLTTPGLTALIVWREHFQVGRKVPS